MIMIYASPYQFQEKHPPKKSSSFDHKINDLRICLHQNNISNNTSNITIKKSTNILPSLVNICNHSIKQLQLKHE